jgi:TIR domain
MRGKVKENNMPRFFISYSRTDREFVTKLTNDLHEMGAEIWIDEKGVNPGDDFMERVVTAMRNCEYFLSYYLKNPLNLLGSKKKLKPRSSWRRAL